ncbi:MAG: hypothetical protein QOE70_4082 [Chthoniobacter sp.]|jgi:ParB-like chromosome segregation protein Spo0J|nr:hypothetical protein [Chthoniobacter sp.]
MNTDEHDDLWKLLGKAREPKVSPFFSRNVLRAIREEQPEKSGVLAWLRRHWQVSAISAGAFALAMVAAIQRPDQTDPLAVLAHQVSSSPDYQVISHLDELLDSEQNSVWLDSGAY